MNKKFLILGAGNAQVDLIRLCKERGLDVYGLSYSDKDRGIPLLDHFEQINIVDTEAVRNYVLGHAIDYIYSVGSDIAVPTFTRVASESGLFTFISPEIADICCEKGEMRRALGNDCPYNVPFALCGSPDELDGVDVFPAIMKPVDSQGQRGVFKVSSVEEAKQRFDESVSHSRSGKVIVEQFIDGDEVSVNAYVLDGEIIFCLLSDRESFPQFPGGIIKAHHLPSVYEQSPVRERVRDLVRTVIGRLGIQNGPVYIQIKISGGRPYLLEVTPRLDGCHMWRLIERYCGVNLLTMTLDHILTGSVAKPVPAPKAFPHHTEFFCEPPGTAFDPAKFEGLYADYAEYYCRSGETVRKMNGFMEKCGYRIFASPRRVGLIGGSGFIGRALAKELGERGFEPVDISRGSGLLRDYSREELTRALRGCDSAVILAARKVSAKEAQSYRLYAENAAVAENSLEACRALGIRDVVFLSSRCVYDHAQPCPVSETGLIRPINYYGISKYTAELICDYRNRKEDMLVKTLRLSQVIGGTDSGYMISAFMKNALEGAPLEVFGKGLGRRDYIYIKDVVRAIIAALNAYTAKGVYNIGSGVGLSNQELAEAVIEGFGSASAAELHPEKPEDPSVIYLDIRKAETELGFVPAYTPAEAFADLKAEL